MSLYQCEKCGAVENTSNGFYHSRGMDIWPEEYRGKELCCNCGPPKYKNPDKKYRKYPLGLLYTDGEGNVRRKDTNEYPKPEDALVDG